MIEPDEWVDDALTGLKKLFGERLRYLGLQGSYRRGEATESSDIDLVVLLDAVTVDDLDAYRTFVRSLPEGEKACGFFAGVREFYHWPRHELFPFQMDTRDFHGHLDAFLPPVARTDIEENARIGASALYHMLTHSYLYAAPEERTAILQGAFKSAFFVMQVVKYLESDIYINIKRELIRHLSGDEKTIVEICLDYPGWVGANSERRAFELLHAWSGNVLAAIPRH